MLHRRLAIVVDGQLRPIGSGEPPFSSAQSPWSGFLLERTEIPAGHKGNCCSWPVAQIALVTAGQASVRYRTAARSHHFVAAPGRVTIFPGGYEASRFSWTGAHEALYLQVAGPTLERLTKCADRPAGAVSTPQLGVQDPQLAALICGMEAEINAGCPSGKLYGVALSLALVAYLAGRYSGAASPPPNGGLSRRQLADVLEYIHANRSSDLSLTELANVAELSPHRFSELFKRSVGTSPHQYVIRERISEAKRLLATRRISIVEVALTLGFASQSHFTHVFHKVTGTTPKRFQRGR